jgi:hypothetical protein
MKSFFYINNFNAVERKGLKTCSLNYNVPSHLFGTIDWSKLNNFNAFERKGLKTCSLNYNVPSHLFGTIDWSKLNNFNAFEHRDSRHVV